LEPFVRRGPDSPEAGPSKEMPRKLAPLKT
jgi:hypothetical protein